MLCKQLLCDCATSFTEITCALGLCVSGKASPVLKFYWQSTEDSRDNHGVRHIKNKHRQGRHTERQTHTHKHTRRHTLPGAAGRPGSNHSAGQRLKAAAESGSLCCTICALGSPPRRALGGGTHKVSSAISPTSFM